MVAARATPEERFERFHAENPRVFELFKKFAREVMQTGRRRFSADAVIQRIRWFVQVDTTGDEFKVNDNYSAYYARLLIRECPEFDGFFELRKTSSDRQAEDARKAGRLF
jgi:hypothetical protein